MKSLGQYLSPQEVAARLGLTRRTVLQMVTDGRLAGAFRLGPKVVRIPERSVVDLIDRSPAVFR